MLPSLRSRQVDLLLGVCTVGLVGTGVVSWAVGTGWNRWWTVAHAVLGLAVLVLAPRKTSTSVRAGMRRRRATRWVSVALGVLVLVAAATGIAHSTGLWTGHGFWSPLWTHFLVAFAAVPIVVWHVASRRSRPHRTDLDRRLLLGGGVRFAAAAGAVLAIEGTTRLVGLAGGSRRFTGSHDVGSFDPAAMPRVSWLDDRAPDIDAESHVIGLGVGPVAGSVTVARLRDLARPVEATLDCTGGWYSTQRWDAVCVADLLDTSAARSFAVTSATGYRRLFPMADAAHVHLAVGYGGEPLRRGHGAPVRLVAPGRRGPWWVKWVVSVEPDDRPAWLQLPFPAT